MKTVQAIIDARGGLEALKENPIYIDNPPYGPLGIEYIGTGPRGLPLISVMHWYEQNGDLMRDPDMVFEIFEWTDKPTWSPISYQQDGLGIYQEAMWQGDDGKVYTYPALLRQLRSFAATWDKNIKAQGFLEAAKKGDN